MGEAVIVSAARTAIGTSFKGSLIDVDAFDLAKATIEEVVARSGLDREVFDDLILGESLYGGGDIARYAAIEAGLDNVPGLALNRHCASGLSAVTTAAGSIKADVDKVVIAGGTQATSTMPFLKRRVPGTDDLADWASPSHKETPDAPAFDMSITVGWNAAVEADVSREEMDAWALRSHERAAAGIDSGALKEEIFPLEITDREGNKRTFEVDEHPRRNTSMERLAALPPLHPEIEGFSITAGNAAGINDAAGAVVIADRSVVDEHGLDGLATVRTWASAGVPANRTGLAPTVAIPKVLDRAGLSIDQVDLWEINEAFASMCVATTKILGIDEDKVNVLGSGCSLGHPIAMTGARMVMTLVNELRRRGGGVGVTAMCAGGGMSTAVVIDVKG